MFALHCDILQFDFILTLVEALPGELINIHSHLIFMERINTVFV